MAPTHALDLTTLFEVLFYFCPLPNPPPKSSTQHRLSGGGGGFNIKKWSPSPLSLTLGATLRLIWKSVRHHPLGGLAWTRLLDYTSISSSSCQSTRGCC